MSQLAIGLPSQFGRRYRIFFDPDEVCPAVQAQRIQVQDPLNTAEREPLAVALPGDVVALMREEPALAIDVRARRRLKRSEGDDGGHDQPCKRSKIARVAGD